MTCSAFLKTDAYSKPNDSNTFPIATTASKRVYIV